MKRFVFLAFSLLLVASAATLAQTRTYTVEDLMKVKRVSDPQVSPDGRWVAFTIGDVNFEANRTITQIYVTPIGGGELKRLTDGDRSSSSPRWSPDGKKIAFTTASQIWTMDSDGDHKEQVTKISTGAAAPVWSPDGKWIAFTSDVYPECSNDDCNKKKDEDAEKSKVKAHITTRLLFRHWDEWRDQKRTHVFVVASNGGAAQEITPGDFDSPPYAAASGVDFAFSPDSKEIAYIRNPDKVEAISTNSDIYVTSLADRATKNITTSNRGYDVGPIYSADGRFILYRSQATPGFEADRWRLMAYNRSTGASSEITKGFDQQIEEFVIAPNGTDIYFTAGERGRTPIFSVPFAGGVPKKVLGNISATNLHIASGTNKLVFASSSNTAPAEIFSANADGSGLLALTSTNNSLMNEAKLKSARC